MDGDKKIKKIRNSGLKPDNLPNARVGHPYKTLISNDFLSSGSSAECWLEGLEKTGLHFFPKKKQITGVPKNSGSFDVHYNIREYNESAGMEELTTHTLKLIIEDDYNIPLEEVDENDPYWKSDVEADKILVNFDDKKRLKKDVIAASRRGYLHLEEGKIREDDFCIRYDFDTRWYILAVADGAGKSKYSRYGSKIACNSSVNACFEQLIAQSRNLKKLAIKYNRRKKNHIRKEFAGKLHNIIALSVTKAYEDIVVEATNLNRYPEDYATTLLLCICKKFEFGWLIGAFTVGDGAVCVFHKDNWSANLMGGIENDTSMRYFLTTPGIVQPSELEQRIRFTIVNDFSALFLMTNGVSNQKFECENDLICFELWNKLWNDINSQVNFSGEIKDVSEQLLKWLDFWTPGKFDDCTVAMIY